MPRFLVLTVLFVAGLLLVDRGVALGLLQVLDRIDTGAQAGRIAHSLRQTDAEIVVFGSSRAAFNVDPVQLEEALGLSAFNAGAPGQGILFARAIQALLLERGSRAKLFVLHVDPKNLWGVDRARLQRLAPYYGEAPAVDALLESTSRTARWKLLSHSYRFNSLLLPIFSNWVRNRPSPGNGFQVIPEARPQNLEPEGPQPRDLGPVDAEVVRVFQEFIEAARARGVQVALVDGPRWRPEGLRESDARGQPFLEALAQRSGAAWILIDERSDRAFENADLFADRAHLRREGAEIYSRRLAERLRPLLEAP